MSRREEALKLRAVGLAYAKIGLVMGITPQRVQQLIKPRKSSKLELNAKLMLSTSEAAKLIGVHNNTLRRWAKKGVIKSYLICDRGDRRFKREDIDSFLNREGG